MSKHLALVFMGLMFSSVSLAAENERPEPTCPEVLARRGPRQ